jgi:UDP-N-acetylglucosamine acyltransferase
MEAFVHKTAVIYPGVVIEDDVYIGPLCIIGAPPEWKGKEHEGKGVLIEKGARLCGMVTVDAGAEQATRIGRDCYLMKQTHVGHDAWLVEAVTLSPGARIGGHAVIGPKTTIGMNAVIHQRKVITAGVMIGMGSVITKKIYLEPYCTYAGNPAKLIGVNTKHPDYPEYTANMKEYL